MSKVVITVKLYRLSHYACIKVVPLTQCDICRPGTLIIGYTMQRFNM